MWRAIKCDADSRELQNNIDVLQQWTEVWLLKLNEEKCKHMSMGMAAHQDCFIGAGSIKKAVDEKRDWESI